MKAIAQAIARLLGTIFHVIAVVGLIALLVRVGFLSLFVSEVRLLGTVFIGAFWFILFYMLGKRLKTYGKS